MTLRVHTARLGSRLTKDRDDVLNITQKSGSPRGKVFAPSWKILGPALHFRGRANELREKDPERAEQVERYYWEKYRVEYLAEMRASYEKNRAAWDELLAQPSVTLVCYCPDFRHCHRTLLGVAILPKLGAFYVGELQ